MIGDSNVSHRRSQGSVPSHSTTGARAHIYCFDPATLLIKDYMRVHLSTSREGNIRL
jgi:hypothetical protein